MTTRYTLVEALELIGAGYSVPVERLPIPVIELGNVFTEVQLLEFKRVIKRLSGHAARDYLRGRMRELLAQIDEKTGQENDADYWAHAVYYTLTRGSDRRN